MAKFQKNTIGFFPKVNSIAEEISVYIISRSSIKINKTPDTVIEVYYKNLLLETTTNDIIELPEEFIDSNGSIEIQIKAYKSIFNYKMNLKTRTLKLNFTTCCSEDDEVLLICSDTLICL